MATIKASQLIILFISGIALHYFSLPNPIYSQPLLIFISFVPLFIINFRINGLKLWLVNFIYFLLILSATFWPINSADFIFDPLQIKNMLLILTLLFTVYSASLSCVSTISKKYEPRSTFSLLAACAFSGLTYLISLVPKIFPVPFESTLAAYPIFLQSANLCGSYFIIFLIVGTNALLAEIFFRPKQINYKLAGFLAILHLLNAGYGIYSLNTGGPETFSTSITCVQPNILSKEFLQIERSKLARSQYYKNMITLSKKTLTPKPDLMIWPELSGENILQSRNYQKELHQQITSSGSELLLGTNFKKYNAAFILKPDGSAGQPYFKTHLFPFSEPKAYLKGDKILPLASETNLKKIGTLICLESIYPQVARKLVNQGASILVLISNDNCFGNSVIPYIHKNLIALRAIENNRFGIHVSTNGPSAIVDNRGRILAESRFNETTHLTAKVFPLTKSSVYSKTGDWFPILCLLFVFATIFFLVYNSTKLSLKEINS